MDRTIGPAVEIDPVGHFPLPTRSPSPPHILPTLARTRKGGIEMPRGARTAADSVSARQLPSSPTSRKKCVQGRGRRIALAVSVVPATMLAAADPAGHRRGAILASPAASGTIPRIQRARYRPAGNSGADARHGRDHGSDDRVRRRDRPRRSLPPTYPKSFAAPYFADARAHEKRRNRDATRR
jgi:hypothetical protein